MGFSIFPREDKFYKLLEKMSLEVLESAHSFKGYTTTKNETERQKIYENIHALRLQSRETSSNVAEELCRCFVTPFDREDIQDFSNLLYKIPKVIEKVTERITMHGMSMEDGDFSHQADLIVKEAEVTKILVQALISGKGSNAVLDYVNTLKDLEHQGDKIRNELIVALFKSDRDIKDIILRRDIYDMLEKVVDRFRDIAGVALQIVLKHS